ncbi:MAG: GTP-binding protein, partial [Ruminococcus sp.]|nr:GTP-binding protein [Ruminococcus sp.]
EFNPHHQNDNNELDQLPVHHHQDDQNHHEHDENCTCGCHDHDHDHEHHHHHADDVFTSWGVETPNAYTVEEITAALEALSDEETYGTILRAKGIVAGTDGQWIHFDYVPGVPDVRHGCAGTTGRLCVIGSKIQEPAIAKLFRAE